MELNFEYQFGDRGVYTLVFYQSSIGNNQIIIFVASYVSVSSTELSSYLFYLDVWAGFVIVDLDPYQFYLPIVVAICIGMYLHISLSK